MSPTAFIYLLCKEVTFSSPLPASFFSLPRRNWDQITATRLLWRDCFHHWSVWKTWIAKRETTLNRYNHWVSRWSLGVWRVIILFMKTDSKDHLAGWTYANNFLHFWFFLVKRMYRSLKAGLFHIYFINFLKWFKENIGLAKKFIWVFHRMLFGQSNISWPTR